MWLSLVLLSLSFSLICADDQQQLHFKFPFSASDSLDRFREQQPYRELPWGELNVIHTTDTHGWLLGHQHKRESSFSGDLGDFYSFVSRMKAEARRRGVDLLLVDSGDRVDGNGLVDAEPLNVKGYTAMQFFQQMPYDLITTGNHELYKYSVALSTYQNLAQHYGNHYVTSNVNITLEGKKERTVELGKRFRKFRTEQGRKVTAFGTLFDFRAHEPGTTIQSPLLMIQEPWFLSAIADRPDVFLLAGHMSIRALDSQWTEIVKAIRLLHPLTPILIFGGHHHIRDCVQEDTRSMSLASGRYMETIGWMSVEGLSGNDSTPPHFSRRYLDQNRDTYRYHAGDNFDTKFGKSLSKSLRQVAVSFNLTDKIGVAPQSYYLNRHPPTAQGSIFNLLTSKVLPLLVDRPDRPYPHLTILNTGAIRFDILKGDFTRNDQWIMLPFPNNFEYIKAVPRSIALLLLPYLNTVGEHQLNPSASVESIYQQNLVTSYATSESNSTLTKGYVTIDGCGPLGDDTLHTPFPAISQPIFVSTAFPPPVLNGEEEKVDVVFFDFIKIDILSALNRLQSDRIYGIRNIGLFVEGLSANTLMETYAKREWN